TAIKVTVAVKETELVKGPYAEYADEYLGLKNPVMANGREYDLLDIQVEGVSQPDPTQFYFVEVNEKTSKEDRNLIFSLAENGVLKAVNAGVSTQNEPSTRTTEVKAYLTPSMFPYATSPSQFQKTDTIIRIVTVDTSTVKKRYFKTSFDEKPSEQKAREAADMVARLREGLVNLLTGFQEISYDPNTLKYMTENVKNLREEYVSMFKGLRLEKVQTYTFFVVPEDDKSSMAITICKFSKESGITEQADAKARDITLTFKRDGSTTHLAGYVPKTGAGESAVLYYRIPEAAQVMVKYQNQSYASTSIPISQFGVVVPMPLQRTRIEFNEHTGAIRNVMFE
ncbi:MAG: hypothetical protein CVU06_15705, partial [Bacteroidetes bacterium HGW-Bacteroidetes-22]